MYLYIILLLVSSVFTFNLEHLNQEGKHFKYQPNIVNNPESPISPKDACTLPDGMKFDCHPEEGTNEQTCNGRQCCWFPRESKQGVNATANPLDVPWCYFPSTHPGYRIVKTEATDIGYDMIFIRNSLSPYPEDVNQIRIKVEFETQQRLHVKILDDSSNFHWESPYPETKTVETSAETQDYDIQFDQNKSGFKIIRKGTYETIFDAQNIGSFIFSNQFLQLSAVLPTDNIYGLGQHRTTLKLNTNWQNFVMLNRDNPPRENTNLYGSHPFYLAIEKSGLSHGVFLKNSNPMEIVLQPGPAITFRPIGGIFDFYFFMGPTPNEVIQQYTDLIGQPLMPPFWAFGFQLCRYGYGSLENTRQTFQRNIDAGIPLDVQWNDLDYMSKGNDFTYDNVNYNGLPDYVKELHESGRHYVLLIDPGVSASEPSGTYPPYDNGVEQDIFVKESNGNIFIGKVWNEVSTAFPDFTNPKTHDYWSGQLSDFHSKVEYDGAWIDMNEPSNFWDGTNQGCPENALDNPPYTPPVEGGKLFAKTVCMSAVHYIGRHYNVHNIYSIAEAISTYNVLTTIRNKRPFAISRATFPGQGKYSGSWSGDIFSTWHDMERTIPDTIFSNMFGIPFTGSDICGFIDDTNEELCLRWMELGAFYPFSRNHNTIGTMEQDPVAMGQEVVDASIKALTIRYSLLPYLYTLFADVHANGGTVIRPLFFEFPLDSDTYGMDGQMLWGSALLIAPVLAEGQTSVTLHLPAANWYDWYTLTKISGPSESQSAQVTLDAPRDTIPLLLRGGYILPMQNPEKTTTVQRDNPFNLLVIPNGQGNAEGSLYWDDGDSIDTYENGNYDTFKFSLSASKLTVSRDHVYQEQFPQPLNKVTIVDQNAVKAVTASGNAVPFSYDSPSKVLVIDNLGLSLSSEITIEWN